MNDKELIHCIQTDKNKGFALFLKQYKSDVYWQIRRLVLQHDDADELTQLVFIKVFKNLDGFNFQSKISTWLYRIAHNETISFLRSKIKKRNISFEDFMENQVNELESDVNFSEDKAELILQKAIAQLPEKQNLIFKMRYYDELKFSQIAELLNLTEGAIKSSYHIAYQKIESYVKQNFEDFN